MATTKYYYNEIVSGSLPNPPTRDEILAVKMHFQGLTVNTTQFGQLPWWETIAWLDNPIDRQSVYGVKRALGDKHIIFDISGWYNEPGQPYQDPEFAHDYTQSLNIMRARIIECIQAGFYVDVRLAGDGQSVNPDPHFKEYNDSVGWTYGHQWLMNNFARIHQAIGDLDPYIIWTPGYDGVFYGWSPEQVVDFGRLFRTISPHGYLAIEFNTGHIPVGEGGSDYIPGGRMQDYDLLYGEFDGWIGQYNLSDLGRPPYDSRGRPNYRGNQIWQIVGRLVMPYNWPINEPADADVNPPPFYLAIPNIRGPWYFNAFEYDVYRWVRGRVTSVEIQLERNYFQSLGCKYVG
jgi:hypothetical protein